MYQEDLCGVNAIDNAFANNSIFCIKAFVDNLLQLTDEMHFRNCFDKALVIMIRKGLDVKDLVNSNLLYPPIWQNQSFFSQTQDIVIKPYNNDVEDLEFENPNIIFNRGETDKNLMQISASKSLNEYLDLDASKDPHHKTDALQE